MNINNIFPLYDKIIVKKNKYEFKKNNIILNNNNKNCNKGIVISTGEGRLLENGNILPLKIKKNDQILFEENYSTKNQIINGEEYFFITENEVLAIIN